MAVKAMDLFEAYTQNKLPLDEGYIVTSFFKSDSSYSIYEIVSYSAVKDIYVSGNGITFQTNGKKLYVLVEPPTYNHRTIEPYCRAEGFQIPLRFSEANIITAKNQAKIIYNKEAQQAISAFTILKPEGINFAFIFFSLPGVFDSIELFFSKTLHAEAGLPQVDAAKAAKAIGKLASETLTWPKDRE
ncbi:MAG TPA: hypothetical protein PK542_07865 [Treponemataceae bacterium]|nr:hypothetical protein [Treponemataceae bacterium]HPS44386.1 hypothetical protein [Treponemataceae bacterium]